MQKIRIQRTVLKTTYFKSPQCHNVQNGRRAICGKFPSVQTNICPYKQQYMLGKNEMAASPVNEGN
jgi:hypothetical protein